MTRATTAAPPTSQVRLAGLDATSAQRLAAIARSLESGRLDLAEREFAGLPVQVQAHPEALRLRGGLLGARGRHAEAIQAMRSALAQRPGDALYHNTLGTLLGDAGDFDAAVAALREACRLQPTLVLAWYNLGVILTRSVRNEEAVEALREAVSLEPGHMDARALLADLLRTTGRTDEAAAEYRRILASQPAAGMAWWGLADLRGAPFSDRDVDAMRALLGRDDVAVPNRIAAGFALARAFDERQRYAESLAALTQAHDLARRSRPWNAEAFGTGMAAVRSAFDEAPAATVAEARGEEVIFIASLPRSGSTLVEQILASHPQVEGAGELADLPLTLGEESRRRGMPFPRWVGAMQAADWQRLGERYLDRTARWRSRRPLFTDKLPNNWMYVDAIRAMLPGARVVICRRDPLETCFSCFRQHLPNGEYAHTFDDLAAFWREFDRHVRHVAARAPQRVFEHHHEALLATPEAHIARLLAFCGLPFDEACLRFHETERDVRSPSATQVRRPLQHQAPQATRYGALLDPLRTALGQPPWDSH